MKSKLPIFLITVLLFLVVFPKYTFAATLTISPETVSVAKGGTGSFNIVLNTEGANASAADAYITIEGTGVEFTSIQPAGNVDISEVFENCHIITNFSSKVMSTQNLLKPCQSRPLVFQNNALISKLQHSFSTFSSIC